LQNNDNLTEFTSLSIVTIELGGTTFKLLAEIEAVFFLAGLLNQVKVNSHSCDCNTIGERRNVMGRTGAGLASGVWVFVLLAAVFGVVLNVPVVSSSGTIYIKADGNIDPPDAPISTSDNVTYKLTDSITSTGDGIVVERDNIIIDGAEYTLQGTWVYYSKGIDLTGRTNVTVKNIRTEAFYYGVYLSSSTSNIVCENDIANNGWRDHGYGIYLSSSFYNAILENDVTHDWVNGTAHGISLDHSSDNSISGNTVTNCAYGIEFSSSCTNVLTNNSMFSAIELNNTVYRLPFDFAVSGSSLPEYVNYVDSSNTVGGKPIYYWVNRRGLGVPSDAGCVILVNCTDIMVQNLNLTGSFPSICLAYTTNCTVTQNEVSMTHAGILLHSSSNNVISKNKVSSHWGNNWMGGICLISSDSNILFGNDIKQIMNYTILYGNGGISLDSCSHNMICENTITVYHRGIFLNSSTDNTIYHNNFINSTQQAYSLNSVNVWDDGYPSGGNYWSDYVGADMFSGLYQNETGSDGIWDSPYAIDEHNRDNYPLVDPYISYTTPAAVEWNKTYGTTNNDWAVSLLQTSDGGFAMAGPCNRSTGNISSVSIVKTDSNGNVQWTRTFEVDSFMGVGVFDRCALFETEERAFVFSSSINITGNIDIWLAKVDEDGQPIWNHTYGGTGNEMLMSAAQTDDDGFLLVAWNYTVGGGTWLVKTDAYGNLEWEKSYGDWLGTCGIETIDGGLALTALVASTSNNTISIILLKMDAAGNILWNQTLSHSQTPIAMATMPRLLQVVDRGFALVVSQSENNDSGILLVKTDEDGNIEWNKTYDNDGWEGVFSITEIYEGYAILGATNSSTVRGLIDVWLVRTDLTGNVLWDSTYGGEGMDIGFSIITTTDGGLAFAGGTNSSGSGEMDFWLVKLSPETQENESLILEVPYQYQGNTSWCAPTSLAMALRYYGVDTHSWIIAEYLGLYRNEGAVFGPELDGKFILTKKVSDYLDAKYPYYKIGYYRTFTSQIFSDIRGNLSQRYPVLLALRKYANETGHAIIVTGFNSSGIFFNDPSGAAKDFCDQVVWVNEEPWYNGYYGFVEYDAISSCICTNYQSGIQYVNTGTLLVLYGNEFPTTGALNLYSAPSVDVTMCCFYIEKSFPFPQVYLDLDKGLNWKSLTSYVGNPIAGKSDILHCRVDIYNHLETEQTYTLLYTIMGDDGITYYWDMTIKSINARSRDRYTQNVTLGYSLTKAQYYHIQLRLMDSQGKVIDTISIPDIYYFASGTSITLQESQHHLYLHVYDSQGRHVGLNHTNNETEIGVPDAYYFDDSNGTITIILPTYNSSFLTVVDAVFAQETIETYNLTITTSNNGQAIDHVSIQETIQKGTQTEYNIEISPSGTIITIPEFSPILILPLFMIATLLLVIIFFKRKYVCSNRK